MKTLVALLSLAGASVALAQEMPTPSVRPVRIAVQHADPWFVVAMLEGRMVLAPEMSTLLGFMGAPPEAGQSLNRLFNGRFFVNAADNSIWFIPGG